MMRPARNSRRAPAAAPAALWVLCAAAAICPAGPTEPLVSYFDQEVRRLEGLARSGLRDCQVEAAQGFYYLGHHRGEAALLPLAGHADALVRLEAVRALGVCGRRKAVAALIERLDDADWEVAAAARDALARMTAAGPFADRPAGRKWLAGSTWQQKQAALLGRLAGADKQAAKAALRALRFLGDGSAEAAVLKYGPRVSIPATAAALERIGTRRSVPALVRVAPWTPEACWALAEIGAGADGVEAALLKALERFGTNRLDAMVCLDRIGSKACGPYLPALLEAFGLVIYRSQTDDLQYPPTAFQRVAANLILRTGRAQQVVDLILAECEGRRKDADTPPALRKPLAAMRKELAPGFVRSDGRTVAQPLAAVPHIIRDRRFVPRLVALLNHPAYIVRVYAAEALAALKAPEAVGPILEVVRTPYGFADATHQVSGKHFARSRFVRWRGYLCIALGKLGGEEARRALEALAADPASYRDIRYGSVVGLRFLGSGKSLPVLERVAGEDIIGEIRREAREAIEEIRLAERLRAAAGADR